MAAKLTIRIATNQELEDIFSHAQKVFEESTMGLFENQEPFLMSPFMEEDGKYLVDTEDGVLKGWIGIASMFNHFGGERVGMIIEIYVIPEHRKQGIARQLCIEGVRYLKEQGLHKVQLNVFAGNNAKQLYQKLGFYGVSTLMEKRI